MAMRVGTCDAAEAVHRAGGVRRRRRSSLSTLHEEFASRHCDLCNDFVSVEETPFQSSSMSMDNREFVCKVCAAASAFEIGIYEMTDDPAVDEATGEQDRITNILMGVSIAFLSPVLCLFCAITTVRGIVHSFAHSLGSLIWTTVKYFILFFKVVFSSIQAIVMVLGFVWTACCKIMRFHGRREKVAAAGTRDTCGRPRRVGCRRRQPPAPARHSDLLGVKPVAWR